MAQISKMKHGYVSIGWFFFSFSMCFSQSKEAALSDNHSNGHNHPTLPIERLNELAIGKSSLNDVHKIFGSNESDRLTFKVHLLPKIYKGKTFEVYRIIRYDSSKFERKASDSFVETTLQETLMLTFFLDRSDRLLMHTVRHRIREKGKKYSGKYHDIEGNPDEAWPNATCDSMFHAIYETKRYQGSRYFGPVETQKCQWLHKLKADVASGVVK